MKAFFGSLFILTFFSCIAQTTYFTLKDGNMSSSIEMSCDSVIWYPTNPPNPLPKNDTIKILHAIYLDDNYMINGTLRVEIEGELKGNQKIIINTTGRLLNRGVLNVSQELHNSGEWLNSGYAKVKSVYNEGRICNLHTIELNSDNVFDNNGGVIECGGEIITCNFKTQNNVSKGLKAKISNVNFCCKNGDNPTWNHISGKVDSSSVSLCRIVLSESVLEMNLLSFTAEVENGNGVLVWESKSELNDHHFVVLRSFNGIDFDEVGVVHVEGNSFENTKYKYIDQTVSVGVIYYKLKQVDYDANYKYSDVLTVDNSDENNVTLYPNPTNSEINIDFLKWVNNNITIIIYNSLGDIVKQEKIDVIHGNEGLILNVDDLKKGIYFLKIFTPIKDLELVTFVKQ